jgi:hypothetical protein
MTLLIVLAGCGDALPPITNCDPVGDIRPVCGMQAPEDIAALPDGRHLLLAHFGGMEAGTGSLSLFDTESEQHRQLFPAASSAVADSAELWGDKDCAAPPAKGFSPHGTHLHQLDSGAWRYLVVNHGDREAVELFELRNPGPDSELLWRGCVRPPVPTFMNDVVGLDNGDLAYTRMFHSLGLWQQVKSMLGMNSGELWRWSPGRGAWPLPGTEASQPNGLEISADNHYLFANMYVEGEVWKVDAQSGIIAGRAHIASVDNSAWGSDGRLWLVRHAASLSQIIACFDEQDKPCPAPFEVIALDPDTMEHERLFSHSGAPMGAATIAVPQNGRVYLGSFVGDRLISVPDFGRP